MQLESQENGAWLVSNPFLSGSEIFDFGQGGRWFRHGENIVVLPDTIATEDSELHEVPASGIPSRKELIDPRIDFHAQEALSRMFKGDPGAREDAGGLFTAVKSGGLAGIYIVDQGVPALRAQRMNLGWWQVIPNGEDAVLLLDPADLMAGPPLIAFRDKVKSDASRLDPALRKSWKAFLLMRAGQLGSCEATTLRPPVPNVVPAVLCQIPQVAPPKPTLPPSTKRPTLKITVKLPPSTRRAKSKLEREVAAPPPQTTQPHVLFPGEAATVTATGNPRPDGKAAYTWSSSDPRVADVFVTRGTQAHPNVVFVTGNRQGDAVIRLTSSYQSGGTVSEAVVFVITNLKIQQEQLGTKFGISLAKGDKEWSPADLADLHRALNLLNAREAQVLRGYTFIRRSALTTQDPNQDPCGLHRAPRIQVADGCFSHPIIREGILRNREIKEGVNLGIFTILHEIGHAMECSEVRASGLGTCGSGSTTTIIREFRARDAPARLLTDDRRTAPEERFAEAFAVFKANPAHLRTAFPRVFQWFAQGRHFRQGPFRL